MIFDVVVVLHFLFNMVFVIGQLVAPIPLKLKQYRYRIKNRRKRHPIYIYKENLRKQQLAIFALSGRKNSKAINPETQSQTLQN